MEKSFDYAQVDNALTRIETSINNIMEALSKRIEVTSYQGEAQPEVEGAVDSIRTYLMTMEEPLQKMRAKIEEIRNAYATSESNIKSALSGISAGNNIDA